MDSALTIARGIVLTVVAFGFMIFVHELGHFLASKLVGVRVDRFSFGFGWKLVGRKWGQTEYMISAIPLGGYVKLAGGDEGEEATGAPDEFVSKTPGQRLLVFVAGPLFSILFGIPLAMAMLIVGRETQTADVSYVAVGGPAWDAGVKQGDRITAIGSRPVESFEGLRQAIHECPFGVPIELVVERGGKELTLTVIRPRGRLLGVLCPRVLPIVQRIEPDSPAASADIRAADARANEAGDRIAAVNGKRLRGWFDFQRAVRASPGKPVALTLERAGRTLDLTVTPRAEKVPDPGFTIRLPAEVGFVRKGFPAEGELLAGDRIVAVNGRPVGDWWEVEDAASDGPANLVLTIERPQGKAIVELSPDEARFAASLRAAVEKLARKTLTVELARGDGLLLADTVGIAPVPAYEIASIHRQAEPPLQVGDRIVRVGNADLAKAIPERYVYTPIENVLSTLGSEDREVRLTVVRRGPGGPQLTLSGLVWSLSPIEAELQATVQPGTRQVGSLGIVATETEITRKESFFGSFVPALGRTLSISTFAFRVIISLFQGDVPASDLMGPVGIAQVTYISATRGWSDLFWLIHLITVNIGVFNLLPLPPLDGGRIVMLAYEKARGKRPSRKVQEAIILAGFGLVVAVFLLATFNDFIRLFSRSLDLG
ncbi:MAG: RIP metalloprotease RseP [Planctomycetes bacterium]|nr:RIP metalloprotease RseP [Planctomycetota bacterium]